MIHVVQKVLNFARARLVERSMRIEIAIPEKCQKCDFENFNIWGTKNGNTRIHVKCMRCGDENFRVDIARGE